LNKYIINGTFGEYSAGTEVEILDVPDSEHYVVHPTLGEVDTHFDIPQRLVTKRRNRTDEIPSQTRKERRIGKPRKQTVPPTQT
jgi:hypothetical protein